MSQLHTGHRARLRQRFMTQGLEGFADHEVLELLLCYALPQKNVNPLAHALIERFGSLRAVLDAAPEEIKKVPGMGDYTAVMLHLTGAVTRRLNAHTGESTPLLNDTASVRAYCFSLLSGFREERVYVVCLNAQGKPLHDTLIAQGSFTNAGVSPRAVAEAVLRHNAAEAVLCHNHPGGTPEPSRQDLEVTAAIAQTLNAIDVVLRDHVIVTETTAVSLAESGWIQFQ